MLVSLKWLRDYVDVPGDVDVDDLATRLTMASSEVEGVHRVGDWDRDLVRVGRVLAVDAHPQADRLRLATVEYGGDAPLQVVCDTDRFIIRTAWTNTVPKQYEIELDDLADPDKRKILWAVFHDPEQLKPQLTRAGITKEAADKFSTIALRLQGRGTPEQIAHFVNQLVFCFFASSVKLLPSIRRTCPRTVG